MQQFVSSVSFVRGVQRALQVSLGNRLLDPLAPPGRGPDEVTRTVPQLQLRHHKHFHEVASPQARQDSLQRLEARAELVLAEGCTVGCAHPQRVAGHGLASDAARELGQYTHSTQVRVLLAKLKTRALATEEEKRGRNRRRRERESVKNLV